MALLYDAALAWSNLLNTSYHFTYGKQGKLYEISLSFGAEHFSHMSGIHYINDIDFGISLKKPSFLFDVLSHKINPEIVEKSSSWADIKGRLEAIVRLEEILDSDFEIYQFNPRYLPFYSKLDARYMIRNVHTGDVVFLFVGEQVGGFYCKSIFAMTDRDYSAGQRKLKLLQKLKTTQ